MKTTVITALLAVALCAGVAEAKCHKRGKNRVDVFRKLDKDHSGMLSFEEFAAHQKNKAKARAIFDKLDKNKDGQLDRIEFRKFHRKGKR